MAGEMAILLGWAALWLAAMGSLSMGPFAFNKGFQSGRHQVQAVHGASCGEAEAAMLKAVALLASLPSLPCHSPLALHLPSALGFEQGHSSVSPRVLVGLNYPQLETAPGCWAVGLCWHRVLAHLCAPEKPESGSPSPELLGTLLLLYSGRLEKQKGRCPSSESGGRGVPGAGSLAEVPALCPPRCLPLAQQVGVDEHKELVRADRGDVALAVCARLVQQHRVEVGACEVQEAPAGMRGVTAQGLHSRLSLPSSCNRAQVLLE